ncbi:hypothetical protein [Pseudonocardia sp. MH-G8]|uniref:hypothetical protein n=1 Tax=Pseudonocardia sp. MH-G8 TaxID=1854588 RepID=UPI001303FA61|nr:hypothetical protein [Pseudonocardia sp. MH-G8]
MVAELRLVPSPELAQLTTSGDAGQADLSYELVSSLDADVVPGIEHALDRLVPELERALG